MPTRASYLLVVPNNAMYRVLDPACNRMHGGGVDRHRRHLPPPIVATLYCSSADLCAGWQQEENR